MKASVNTLLVGYFGANNFGDEWMLATFLRGCRKFHLPIAPIILSRHPEGTEAEHDCPAIPRQWRAILKALQKCQLVIGCGGSLLQDATSFRSLLFYALLFKQAKMMGKKVALLGQGLGPLRRQVSQWLAKWALKSCDLVTFRDPISEKLAQKLGTMPKRMALTADLTFAWDEGTHQTSPAERPYPFGLNLRPLPTPKERMAKGRGQVWREALKEWLKSQGATLLLLPLQREVDEKALAPFAEGLPADWWLWAHWTEALEGIQRVAFLVAMRLHGLIAACLFSVPFVGIGYDPKVSGVLGEAFKGHLLPLSASAETVVAVLRQGMETADRFPDRADAFVTEQRRLARQNFLLLQDLL